MRFFKKLLWKLSTMDDAIITGAPVALEHEFSKEIRKRKEKNSQIIWSHYYVPLAVREILEEKGNITEADNKRVELIANSLLFRDMADGVLNEFYQFIKE